MTGMIDVNWLAAQLKNRTMRGIALDTATLIRSGSIKVGAHLPSVRELAQALNVSPATVSAAWGQLRRQKVIAGRGRNGIWVCGDRVSPRPIRFEQIGNFGEHIVADLVMASPDPALLPDLTQALISAAHTQNLHSYQREAIMPVLRDAVEPTWPYRAGAFMATDGGFDGMNLMLQTLIMPGSQVVIEDPTASRLLDMLDNIGATVLPVACDEEGPMPDQLAAALAKKPAAFIYQPRTHSHCGHAVTTSRFNELATVLAGFDGYIFEDDGIGDLSAHPARSLGTYYPERTVHVRSYSKVFGPDLRMAVMSGPAALIKQIQSFRNFGVGWSSRLLQHATAWLLHDADTLKGVAAARQIYAERRAALVSALARRGITVPARDGLALWLPVPSEQYALVTLAARGYAVLPGKRCLLGEGQFIRISTSLIKTEQAEAVAEAIALAYGD